MGSLSSTPHYPTSDSFLERCLAAWSDGPQAPPCSALHSVVRSQGGDGEGKAGGYSRTFVEPVFSADGCQASTQPSLLAFVLCLQPPRPRIPSGWLWPPAQFSGWLGGRGKGFRCCFGKVWQEGGCHFCFHQHPAGTTFNMTSEKLGRLDLI